MTQHEPACIHAVFSLWPRFFRVWIEEWSGPFRRAEFDPDYLRLYKKAFRAGFRAGLRAAKTIGP